jgi:hypothetical protein
MLGKRVVREAAENTDLQDPRDKAKARLLEIQSREAPRAGPPLQRLRAVSVHAVNFRWVTAAPWTEPTNSEFEDEMSGLPKSRYTYCAAEARDGLRDASPKVTEFP